MDAGRRGAGRQHGDAEVSTARGPRPGRQAANSRARRWQRKPPPRGRAALVRLPLGSARLRGYALPGRSVLVACGRRAKSCLRGARALPALFPAWSVTVFILF